MPSTLVFDIGATATDPTLPFDYLDPLIAGANGGTLLDFDLANGGYSWPSAAPPANGAAIFDLTETPAKNSAVTLGGSGTIGFAGNGFDFSNVVNPGHRIEGPASVAASIWGGGSANQYFLALLYLKLPALADWPAAANYTRPVPMLCFTTAANGFTGEADLFSLNFSTTGGQLRAVRPTAGTTAFDVVDLTPASADYGSVVQLALWRNAAGQAFRLKSANGTLISTRPTNANNATDFSAGGTKKPQIGVGLSAWKNSTPQGKTGLRIYRAYIENLVTSGRDPAAVADLDYAAVTGLRGNPFS